MYCKMPTQLSDQVDTLVMNNITPTTHSQVKRDVNTTKSLQPINKIYTKTQLRIIKLINRLLRAHAKQGDRDHIRIEREWIADQVGCDVRTIDRANAKFREYDTFNMKYGWEFGKRIKKKDSPKTLPDKCIHYSFKTPPKEQNVATNTYCNKPKGLFNKIQTAIKKRCFNYIKINKSDLEEVRNNPYFDKYLLDWQMNDLFNKPHIIQLLERGRKLIKGRKSRIKALWSEFIRWHESYKNLVINLEKAWIGYVLKAKKNKVFYFPVYKIKSKYKVAQ